jgi:gliding motility-associated-like protein
MTVQTNRAVLLLWIIIFPFQTSFSQHLSRNNYTGPWETPSTWNPLWTSPETNIKNNDITIYGYITRNGSLQFTGGSSNLIVYDTLVVKGNFSIDHENSLIIKDNAILIIKGDLFIDDDADVTVNGYLIVTGNILMNHHVPNGSFTSNDNPVKVFFGGTISPEIPAHNSKYPVFNCSAYIQYPNSGCSYGTMTDFANDPMYSFFQSTYMTVTISVVSQKVCQGETVELNSSTSGGSGTYEYTWRSVPAGFTSMVADPVTTPLLSTIYIVSVFDGVATVETQISITVTELPAIPVISANGSTTFCAGGSVKLTSDTGAVYLWSNGATTSSITVSLSGTYTVRVTNAGGCQSSSAAATAVTVNTKPPTPLVTASGPVTFCDGGSVTLTSTAATGYLWSTGETTADITPKSSGSNSVRVTDSNGCQSPPSPLTIVTVNRMPVAVAGPDKELKYVFETLMEAELSSSESGIWSVVNGTGQFADIHSPSTMVTGLMVGKNVFLWKVINGICEATDEVSISVLDLFIPSVITPDNDGSNDFFIISETIGSIDMIIFNRWGNLEYENSNYLNDWNGRNNKGQELPGDTYFYVLKLENGTIRKGSVLILR